VARRVEAGGKADARDGYARIQAAPATGGMCATTEMQCDTLAAGNNQHTNVPRVNCSGAQLDGTVQACTVEAGQLLLLPAALLLLAVLKAYSCSRRGCAWRLGNAAALAALRRCCCCW
jgi:hypothetical protein